MDPFNFLGFVFSAYSAYKASGSKTDQDVREFIQSWSPLFELLRFFKSTHNLCQTIRDHKVADLFQNETGTRPDTKILQKKWRTIYVGGLKSTLDDLKDKIDNGFIKTGDQKQQVDKELCDAALKAALSDLRIKEEIKTFQKNFPKTITSIDSLIVQFRNLDDVYSKDNVPNPEKAEDVIDGAAALAMQDTDIMMLSIIPILIYFYEELRRDKQN